MIDAIRKFLQPASDTDTDAPPDIDLAAAALLIEVMVIDTTVAPQEEATIKALLEQRLALSPRDSSALFDAARQEVKTATSLYQFTRQINDEFNPTQKFQLVTELWKVAYADGDLDKYEEHIIRRIGELIHLPHSEFIRAKQKILKEPLNKYK